VTRGANAQIAPSAWRMFVPYVSTNK
jgi:hypothetical protein